MLPQGYEQPAAIVLLLGGALACFAGYRLFRIVLGIYGFILGAMIASSVVGVSNTIGMIGAALVGGLVGSLLLVFAWFIGVSLVGAGIGVLVAHIGWSQLGASDPPAIAVIAAAIAGAIGAIFVQKYVIVAGTAFGGAWTIVVAGVNLFPQAQQGIARAASDSEVWILYPTATPGVRWAPIAWIGLGLLGTAVQLATVSGRKRK
jgi:hypothetical protein